MDEANIKMILNFDVSDPAKENEFIEHLEHHFSLGDATPLGIMDAYEQCQTPKAKAKLCALFKNSVRENIVASQVMKIAKDIGDTTGAVDSLEHGSQQELEQKKSDRKGPTMPNTLSAFDFTTQDILMQSLTEDLEVLKRIRGSLDQAESFTKQPLGLQPLSLWDEIDSIRNGSRSIFSDLRIIRTDEIVDQLEKTYENEYNLLFSEARKQKIMEMKIDLAVGEALTSMKPSGQSSASIYEDSRRLTQAGEKSIEAFFVGHYMHLMKSGSYFTLEGQKSVEEYFYKLIDTLKLSEKSRQEMIHGYQQQLTAAQKTDYIRNFVLKMEGFIQGENPILAARIETAETYWSAANAIYLISVGVVPGSGLNWDLKTGSFQVADAEEYYRRALWAIESGKIDKEGIVDLLKKLSETINQLSNLNRSFYERDKKYVAPQNQMVLLGEPGANLLLSSLKKLVQTIPPNAEKPFIQDLCAMLNAIEAGLSELKTLQTTISFSDTALKQIKKAIATARSVPVIKTFIQEEQKAKKQATKKLSSQVKPASSTMDQVKNATSKSFADRLSGVFSNFNNLRSDGAQSSDVQQRAEVAKQPKTSGISGLSPRTSAKKDSKTTYESTLRRGLEEYNTLVDNLSRYSEKVSTVVSAVKKEEGTGAKQLIIHHKTQTDEKITHYFDQNKLKINLHPGNPADWSIIHVAQEAAAHKLNLILSPKPAKDVNTLIRVFHAALLYADKQVHLHADDLARLEALDPSSGIGQTYQTLKTLSADVLKERSEGQPLGKLQEAPNKKLKL